MLPLAHMGITVTLVRAVESQNQSQWVDYRLLLVASLLPDLVDKPLAHLLFDRSIHEGRMFGHSLALLLLLSIIHFVYRRWRQDSIIKTIIWGTAMHDILDVMWRHPGILFWPLYGWRFPRAVAEAWQGMMVIGGHPIRQLEVLDVVGVIMMLVFFTKLGASGKIMDFFKTGKLKCD